jgi:hypothetical protein
MSVVNISKEKEEMVYQLENLLESVKSGHTVEVCFVWREASGNVDHDFVGLSMSPSAIIGELEVLKQNYMTMHHKEILYPFFEV